MVHSEKNSFDEALAHFRNEIDAIDEALVGLITKRSQVVAEVGKLKATQTEKITPIRPAREAAQLRKLYQRFKSEAFPEAAATQVWRHIINGALSIEGAFQIGVCAPASGSSNLLWLAREYFGSYSDISREHQPRILINKVASDQCNIAVLPYPNSEDSNPWWLELMQDQDIKPSIFLKLPFLPQPEHNKTPSSNATVQAFAVAKVAEEDFGEQAYSAIAMRTETNCSMGKLQETFRQAGFDAQWLSVANINEMERAHFIEVRGNVSQNDPRVDKIHEVLQQSLIALKVIGRYAAPIV